jgi:hypothetical protein
VHAEARRLSQSESSITPLQFGVVVVDVSVAVVAVCVLDVIDAVVPDVTVTVVDGGCGHVSHRIGHAKFTAPATATRLSPQSGGTRYMQPAASGSPLQFGVDDVSLCVLVVDVAVVADVSVAVAEVAVPVVAIGHVPQRIGHALWYSTRVTLLAHLATSSQAMSSTFPLQVSGGVVVVLVVTVMTTLQVAQSTGHSC